jgi:hypothetical protein
MHLRSHCKLTRAKSDSGREASSIENGSGSASATV